MTRRRPYQPGYDPEVARLRPLDLEQTGPPTNSWAMAAYLADLEAADRQIDLELAHGHVFRALPYRPDAS